MTTIQQKIIMTKIEENVLNFNFIEIIALHIRNGYTVGCTAICDGILSDIQGDDFEIVLECYRNIKNA